MWPASLMNSLARYIFQTGDWVLTESLRNELIEVVILISQLRCIVFSVVLFIIIEIFVN